MLETLFSRIDGYYFCPLTFRNFSHAQESNFVLISNKRSLELASLFTWSRNNHDIIEWLDTALSWAWLLYWPFNVVVVRHNLVVSLLDGGLVHPGGQVVLEIRIFSKHWKWKSIQNTPALISNSPLLLTVPVWDEFGKTEIDHTAIFWQNWDPWLGEHLLVFFF